MHKKSVFKVKAFATYVAISFLFASIFIVIVSFGLNSKINSFTSLINTFAIKKNSEERKVLFDKNKMKLKSYPSYGSKYAQIVIPSVGIDLPVYYGDNLEILSYGIGQYAGSYFPGEGGTIILAGHNDSGYFDKILDLKDGDKVNLKTSYGDFVYTVESSKIVNENDDSAFPVQTDRELLIMYTCYPLGVGKKTERYVVYAVRSEG